MQPTTHECACCGRDLTISHSSTYDGYNESVDIAYCDNCSIKYQVDRDMLWPELSGEGAAEALEARMDAVNKPLLEILEQAFNDDPTAWKKPIRTSRFADRIEQAVHAPRTTAVEAKFHRGSSLYAELRFYASCSICGNTHLARELDDDLTNVGRVDFTMVDGPVKLRCYCGTVLDDVTGPIEKTWECGGCGRTFERQFVSGPRPPN